MSKAEEIDNQAADWILQETGPDWNLDGEAQRDAWLDLSPAHRVSYLRLRDAWSRADRLAALKGHHWKWPRPKAVLRLYKVAIAMAAVVGIVAMTAGVWWRWHSVGERYETPVGVRETVNLSDGSIIELNTNTRIQTNVTTKRRQVVLNRGEAFFQVVHDAHRPFVVIAGNKRIIDLGTKFSVRLDGQNVRILVTEGQVRVENIDEPTSPAVVAKKDTQVTTGPDVALVSTPSTRQVADSLGWRTGYLVFDKETLADVVAEFNRYNDRKLVLEDPSIGSMKVGGSFKATNVGAFATLLHDTFGLDIQESDSEIKISR